MVRNMLKCLMKKIIFFLTFFVFLWNITAENQDSLNVEKETFSIWGSGEVFKCSPLLDGILLGTGAAILGAEIGLQKGAKLNQKDFDGKNFDKGDVNAFDRFFMQPYSKPLDITATVLMYTALATPAVLLVTEKKSEWLTIAFMYGETILFEEGIKNLLKISIARTRPYMYFDGFPEKDVDDYDWNKSSPSGHSAISFASATFLSYVFCKYNPESKLRFPIVAGSYALATTTALLRVASGNHFPTDILFGAALGTGIGFLVPCIHALNAKMERKGLQVAILPGSVGFCYRF